MNDPHHHFAQSTWFTETSGSLDDYLATTPTETKAADWPLADQITKNVLIYDGNAIRAMDNAAQQSLMSEWARAFLSGPGIVVIKRAFGDTAPLDRATELFTRMIVSWSQTR